MIVNSQTYADKLNDAFTGLRVILIFDIEPPFDLPEFLKASIKTLRTMSYYRESLIATPVQNTQIVEKNRVLVKYREL